MWKDKFDNVLQEMKRKEVMHDGIAQRQQQLLERVTTPNANGDDLALNVQKRAEIAARIQNGKSTKKGTGTNWKGSMKGSVKGSVKGSGKGSVKGSGKRSGGTGKGSMKGSAKGSAKGS